MNLIQDIVEFICIYMHSRVINISGTRERKNRANPTMPYFVSAPMLTLQTWGHPHESNTRIRPEPLPLFLIQPRQALCSSTCTYIYRDRLTRKPQSPNTRIRTLHVQSPRDARSDGSLEKCPERIYISHASSSRLMASTCFGSSFHHRNNFARSP